MSLPRLPEPIIAKSTLIEGGGIWGALYDAEQMQAYGQQCREAALEEAAKCAEDYPTYGEATAEEIRSLK